METDIIIPVRKLPVNLKSLKQKNILITEGDVFEKVRDLSQTKLKNIPYQIVTFVGNKTNAHDQQIKIINFYKELAKILKHDSSYKIINISSSSIYGSEIEVPIEEHTQAQPSTVYGKSKKEVEEIFQDLADLKKIYNFRVGNVLGSDSLTGQLSGKRSNLIRLEMYQDGKSAKRSFIDPNTLNQIILHFLQFSPKSGNYNVATEYPHYMEDLLLECSVDYVKIQSKNNNNQYIILDTKKLKGAVPFDLNLCLKELIDRSFHNSE